MISKKVFTADGSTNRFLSDFIIINEQYTRPYVYIYDNTLPTDGTGDVLQNGSTLQIDYVFPTNIWKRGLNYPKSSDLVPSDNWDVVDNSILFYSNPLSPSTVWVEVATTSEEFGTTLAQPSVERAEEAAEIAVTNANNAAASASSASTSASNASASALAASTSESNALVSETNASTSASNALASASESSTSASNAATSASEASTSASNASASESYVVSVVNNKGSWSLLSGSLNVPANVNHNGSIWVLNLNLADVTLSEPTALNTDWTQLIVANDVLLLTGGTMIGAITAISETKVAMPADNIDLATGNLFTKTISTATTLTVSNVVATGSVNSFILELTNAGSAVITWFAGVKWASGTAPTLTAAGVDILGFYTHDAGTTWRGIILAKDSK